MQNPRDIIITTIENLYGENASQSVELWIPPKGQSADYCFNIGTLAKSLKRSPGELVKEIQPVLQKDIDTFTLVSTVGIYINLCLTDAAFIKILKESTKEKHQPEEKQWTVVVDYIGVNIGKPLHIWHICTPSIGQVFCNIYHYKWSKVVGDVHTGDWWGIFWRLIAWWKRWGDKEKLEAEPVNHLLDLYQKISALIEPDEGNWDESVDVACRVEFKKLSEWDPENMKLWSEFTAHSLHGMQETIDLLHVKPDVAIGESFYEGLPLPKIGEYPELQYTMKDVVQELVQAWIAERNEDWSVSISFPENKKLPSNILQKRDGTHGYFASDLACIKYRMTNWWDPKKIIYCTDIRQQLHFQQVFTVARMAGWINDDVELVHAPNGFISLPEWAMSTRKGNIIRLDDLIDEAFLRTKRILEEKWRSISDIDIREIAVGGLKYSYLMQDRERNVVFNWDKALNFEGNSGPYIQYAYVRAKKLKEQLGTGLEIGPIFEAELSEDDKDLIKTLVIFDEKVDEVLKNHKPHVLTQYCYTLAWVFNSFYSHTPSIVNEEDQQLKNLRTQLVSLSAERLKLGFQLLGIEMPSEM